MRAINLVPAEERPGRVNGGKSGGAVYGLLGVLVLFILAAAVFSMAKRDEARAEQDLAAVEQSTQSYTQVASQYTSFETAAKQASERINTVRSLADARFDWAGSMRDLSRLVPYSTRISALTASVSAGAGETAGGGAPSQFRSQIGSPAISIAGCSLTQDTVATLVTQLQAMRRVTNVTLESSKKAENAGADDGQCSHYEFAIVVHFAPGGAKASADAAPSSTPATTTVSTEPAGGTTPPATTPAAGN